MGAKRPVNGAFGFSAAADFAAGSSPEFPRSIPGAGWLPPVVAFGASALYELIYAVLGSVLGQPQIPINFITPVVNDFAGIELVVRVE